MKRESVFDKRRLKKITQAIINLPTLPTIVAKIIESIDDPKSSAGSLTKLIKTDQVLTAKILNTANSAYYAPRYPICSINQAIVRLGFEKIKSIGLSVAVISRFARARSEGELLDYSRFWEHSVGVGAASRMLARMHDFRSIEDEAFVAGLVHDIGKVILSQFQTDNYSECLKAVATKKILLSQAEDSVFGVSHADVGSWLAQRWNLPKPLSEAIKLHHIPLTAKTKPELCAIVHFADILTRAARIGSGGDPLIPPFYRGVLHTLRLKLDGEDRVDLPFYLDALHEEMENADTLINIILGRAIAPEGGEEEQE